jgi:hypothetical protein
MLLSCSGFRGFAPDPKQQKSKQKSKQKAIKQANNILQYSTNNHSRSHPIRYPQQLPNPLPSTATPTDTYGQSGRETAAGVAVPYLTRAVQAERCQGPKLPSDLRFFISPLLLLTLLLLTLLVARLQQHWARCSGGRGGGRYQRQSGVACGCRTCLSHVAAEPASDASF